MGKKLNNKQLKKKKAYIKPEISEEKIFETSALACGKCTTGPIAQYACNGLPQKS